MQQAGIGVAAAALLALWPADNRVLLGAEPALPLASRETRPAGQLLLVEYQCGACHRIDGVSGATGTRGSALHDYARRTYIAGRVPNTTPLLARWIAEPHALVPGTAMPTVGVPAPRAQLMAAYLHAPS